MNRFISTGLAATAFIFGLGALAAPFAWDDISLDAKAEILESLDFSGQELPDNTKVISLKRASDFDPSQIYYEPYRNYVVAALEEFEDKVSTEEIEQSDWDVVGEPEVTAVFLLVSTEKEILGGYIRMYQQGADPETGDYGDINWQASVRFDGGAQVLRSENGYEYDDLYFEWSGH